MSPVYTHDISDRNGNIAAVIELTGKIDPEKLIEGLRLIVANQPYLRVIRKINGFEHSFDCLENIKDLPVEILKSDNKNYWQEVFKQALEIYYQNNKPLWKLFIVHNSKTPDTCHIVFGCSHFNGDGVSITNFFKDLLNAYVGNYQQAPYEFLPCGESFVQHLDKGLVEPPTDFKQTAWTYDIDVDRSKKYISGVKYIHLSTQQTQNIIKTAKQNNITVNSYLNATIMCAFSNVIKQPIQTALYTPVDLRPLAKPSVPADYFGVFVTVGTTYHSVDDSNNLIAIAKDYEKQLKQQIPNHIINPVKMSEQQAQQMMDLWGGVGSTHNQYSMGVCTSNMGNLNFDTQFADIKWEKFYISAARNVGDMPFFVAFATINGQLNLSITYTQELMSEEHADAMRGCLLKYLG